MDKQEYWDNIGRKIADDVVNKLMSSKSFDVNNTDECGTSLLHISCLKGMTDLCTVLLQNNANINITDIHGRTPLMIASYYGYSNIVQVLLQQGADLKHVDMYGFSAVMYAVYSGNIDIFKLFQEKGFLLETFPNTFLGCMTPLTLASSIGNTEIGRYIISQKPDFIDMAVTKSGMVPVMLALCGGHKDMVEILLDNQANLHAKSSYEMSCVGYARSLSFPLLKLNIPSIEIIADDKDWDFSPRKRRKPPLTPNIYMSPTKTNSPKECLKWMKISLKPKRSKSVEKKKNVKMPDDEDENVLKSIFQLSNLEQYWSLFKEQEINFNTFLTMDDEDLTAIGISKSCTRQKLLILIDHYKKIFYSK